MKKITEILIISGALIFLGVSMFFSINKKQELYLGAPTLSYQKSLLPITTNLYDIGSSTPSKIWNRLFVNYASTTAISTTNASTTNLVISGLLNCNTIDTGANGTLLCGTDDVGTGAPFAWTPTTDCNSTSTRLIFGNGFISQASSTFSNTGTTTFSGDIAVKQLQVTGSKIYGDTDVSHLNLNSVSGTHLGYHNGGGENTFVLTGGVAQFTLNGLEISRFTSTGLGIFDTSPTYALDVTGDGHFTSYVDASYFTATSTTVNTFPKVSMTDATTTSLSVTGLFNIGGDYLNELCGTGLTCTGNALTTSLGTSIDISAETNLATTFPIIITNDTLSFGGLSTSTAAVIGNIPYFSGVNTFDNVATTSATIGTGLSYSGTFGSVVGGSAGTLTLDATGNWTGTIDSNNFAGGAIGAGELIYGGSAGSFSELAVSTNGYVLSLSGGIPAWVASTTFSGGLTYSGGNVTADLGTSIDISSETNLAATAPITLTGDTLSLADVVQYPAFTYATSTSSFTGTTTIPLGVAMVAETWNSVSCFTDTGSVWLAFDDGTNVMNYLQASTTVGVFALSTNNSFSISEKRYVKFGNPASSPTKISCSVKKTLSIN